MNTDLELVVEETSPGHFYWTLVRPAQSGERSTVVDHAHGPVPSRSLATATGLAALRRGNVRADCLPAKFDSQGSKHADTGPAPLGFQ